MTRNRSVAAACDRRLKHDLVAIVDLNGDHRPDVLTTEERAGEKGRGLGVIWYESP